MDTIKAINNAMEELKNLPDEDKVQLGRKFYAMVKDRNHIFRKHFGFTFEIITEFELHEPTILRVGEEEKVLPGSVICKTYCKDQERILAVGIAEAQRNSAASKVIEKTQTVSLGRMLACLGLDGGEFASGDEMKAFLDNDTPEDDAPKGAADDVAIATNVVPMKNIKSSQKKKVGTTSSIADEDVKTKLKDAKHLGDLEQVFTNHRDQIINNKKLLDFYNNRKESINEWR